MSCTIIDKNFIDDLSPYTLSMDGVNDDKLTINFDNGESHPIFMEMDYLPPIPLPSPISEESNTFEYWQPMFIRRYGLQETDRYGQEADLSAAGPSTIYNKKINRNFTAGSNNQMGIENFITFKPVLNNWSTNASMSLDWLLTDNNFAFDPTYGILGWVKNIPAYNIINAPIETIFTVRASKFEITSTYGTEYTVKAGDRFIKYSEDILVNINASSNSDKFFNLNSFNADIKDLFLYDYGLSGLKTLDDQGNIRDGGDLGDTRMQMYIADGDFFSYHSSVSDKFEAWSVNSWYSKSHVSGTLWKEYQHFYHIITEAYSRSGDKLFGVKEHRAINKLAAILSTHPLRDRITQNVLLSDYAIEHIERFLTFGQSSTEGEIRKFNTFNEGVFGNSAVGIDREKNPGIPALMDNARSQSNYISGFINNKKDLFNKLINKYSAYLKMSGVKNLKYKEEVSPHLYINQVMTNHCGIEKTGDVLYNNISFKIGGRTNYHRFSTDFSKNTSKYNIETSDVSQEKLTIPLYDSGKYFAIYDIDKDIAMTAGPDIYIPVLRSVADCGVPEEFNGFDFDPDLDRVTGSVTLPEYKISEEQTDVNNPLYFPFYEIDSIQIKWSKISGPSGGVEIEDADTLEPTFKFKAFGKFTFQLTATLDTLNIVDLMDIYIVNKAGCNIGVDEDNKPAFKRKEDITNQFGEVVGTRLVDDAVSFIKPGSYDIPSVEQSPISFNTNRFGEVEPLLDSRYTSLVRIPNDRNISNVPNITELLFSSYGAILPAKSNSYVSVFTNAVLPNEDGQFSGNNYIARLDSAKRLNRLFYPPVKQLYDSSSEPFEISYRSGNTMIKLYKIRLEQLRSKHSTGHCKSIYQNRQYQTKKVNVQTRTDFKTSYDRSLPGESWIFSEYERSDNRNTSKISDIELYPHPELSDRNVNILPNAGRGESENLPFNGVVENELLFLPKSQKDKVSGHDIDQESYICFLQNVDIETYSDTYNYNIYNPNIKFIKGTFFPDRGFITDIANDEAGYNKTSSLKFNPGDRTSFVFKGPGFYNSLTQPTNSSAISVKNSSFSWSQDPENPRVEILTDEGEPDDIDIHHGYRTMTERPFKVAKNYLLHDEHNGSYGSYDFAVRGRRFSDSQRLQGSNLLFPRIRNIEVKLNFLNQINLKNTKIWIQLSACKEVKQQVTPSEDSKMDWRRDPFYGVTENDNTPIISNISQENQKLKDVSTTRVPSDFLKHKDISEYLLQLQTNYNKTGLGFYDLVLLNNEHVCSNTVDTTLYFSDRFSKHLAARNQNTFNQAINIDQDVNTTNYIKLQPTLALPYYDLEGGRFLEGDSFIAAIKKNNIFLPVNSFSKFFNLPVLMGALDESAEEGEIAKPDSSLVVTLHIDSRFEQDMTGLDTVKDLSDKIDPNPTEEKQISDIIFNSLCSWEIILHTDTDDFKETDSLGQIKYGWTPNIPGYNFISDDSNVSNKLPKSVIDAPNQSLNDLSPCIYDEETTQSVSELSLKPNLRFPSEQVVIALGSLFLGALGGVIGLAIGFSAAMAALAAVTRFLSAIRSAEIREQLNRAFVRSVYNEKGYGGHDKILLHVGANQPFVYDLEAPIYKYSNTPLLKKKVRKYVKTSEIERLSKFNIIEVKDLSDLFSSYEIREESNIDATPYGSLTIISGEISLNDGTVLDNTNIPLSILTENNLLGLDLERTPYMSLIEGSRAYNYFEVGQTIQNEDGGGEFIIKAKGQILKDYKDYTVLEFENQAPIDGSIVKIPDDLNNNIIVWTDKEPDHYNVERPATAINNTLFPQGAYGNSTPVVESNFLSNQLQENDLPTIYEIFNNQECNVKPTNRVEVYGTGTDPNVMSTAKSGDANFAYNLGAFDAPDVLQGLTSGPTHELTAGYSYNLDNILNPKDRAPSNFIIVKNEDDDTWPPPDTNADENFFWQSLNSIHNKGSESPNLVELNNTTFSGIDPSGYIVVEGDYELGYATSLDFDGDKDSAAINKIMSRLKHLDNPDLLYDDDDLYSYSSIPILRERIASLEDDVSCLSASDFDLSNCPKIKAEQALSILINEKNRLLNLLDTLEVKYDENYNVIYNVYYDEGSEDIIPHKTIKLTGGAFDYPVTIEEETLEQERYWINIDPEQMCKTSRDAGPKILVEAKYFCYPSTAIVAGELGSIPTLDRDAQNICPTEAGGGRGTQVGFDSAGNAFTYTIAQDEIQKKKNRFLATHGVPDASWEEITFPGPSSIGGIGTATRSFFIRPGTNASDIFVEVTEKYLVPDENYFRSTIGLESIEESEDSDEDPIYVKGFAEYRGKVKDIIPDSVLNSENIVCRSKVIPRKLRGVDTDYVKYKTDFNGNLIETLPSVGPGGPFTSNIAVWHAIDTETKEYKTVPDYFKIKNEMIYRSYFGAAGDGQSNLEHTDELTDSLDPFEWIPYEYDAELNDD